METEFVVILSAIVHILIQIGLCVRVLLRPHREPASRIAWIVVIIALPVAGILAYILLGEVNIGRRRVERMRKVLEQMPSVTDASGFDAPDIQPEIPERYQHLFRSGSLINGFEPVGGN